LRAKTPLQPASSLASSEALNREGFAMPIEPWMAFVVAAAGVIALPGPTVLLILGYALSGSPRRALFGLIGVALGDTTAITLSFAGVGALLAASVELFVLLKWQGAAYLVLLGIELWRRRPARIPGVEVPPSRRGCRMISKAYVVTVLNPKGVLFFTAFMPQFVDAGAPALPQMATLGVTYVSLALLILAFYVRLAGRMQQALSRPGTLSAGNRLGGALLIGAGVLTASLQQP
jgi:threonine/homoserine/homoserine lactone efflux protein